MPHQACSICRRKDVADIDADLGSVRTVAKRFGVTPATLDRHRHHDDPKKNRPGTDEIKRIDKEIRKLHHAETAARKRRDNAGALAISRELRNWHTLKSKLLGAMGPEKDATAAPITQREALQVAFALVEAAAAGDQRKQVTDWLSSLLERLRPAEALPAQESASVEPAENGAISGTQDVEHV